MRNLILAALLLTSTGCAKHTISVDAIDSLITIVSARHDAYIDADKTLDAGKKADYKRSTALLNAVVAEAKK